MCTCTYVVTEAPITTTARTTRTVRTTVISPPPPGWKVTKCIEDYERWEREHGGSEAPREATFFPDPYDCNAYIECTVKRTATGDTKGRNKSFLSI